MSRGGARCGAGAPRQHDRITDFPALDVRALRRDGYLRPGVTCDLRFETGQRIVIACRADADNTDRLTVDIACAPGGAFHGIPLLRTPCHFGGSVPWFRCPGCARRCATLYAARGRLECRRCARLTYPRQAVSPLGRFLAKLHGFQRRLPEGCCRPPGMRRRDYERLLRRLARVLAQADARTAPFFRRANAAAEAAAQWHL